MKTKIAIGIAVLTVAVSAIGKDKTIKVETDPPGMRIYFAVAVTEKGAIENREYVGTSPCQVKVQVDGNGRFKNTFFGWTHPVAVFMADPPSTATNLFAQKQDFRVPAHFYKAPAAPDAVFFDMHKK